MIVGRLGRRAERSRKLRGVSEKRAIGQIALEALVLRCVGNQIHPVRPVVGDMG